MRPTLARLALGMLVAAVPAFAQNTEPGRTRGPGGSQGAQSQPVSVTFRSDGETWVSISNFRMLGRIKEETLKILPGDYEVVGRRKGYQDVLLLLKVRNDSTPPVVNVVCTLRANG